jgi:hypothetical protein
MFTGERTLDDVNILRNVVYFSRDAHNKLLFSSDEPEGRRIDAVAQAAAISRAIREDVAEAAVAVDGISPRS